RPGRPIASSTTWVIAAVSTLWADGALAQAAANRRLRGARTSTNRRSISRSFVKTGHSAIKISNVRTIGRHRIICGAPRGGPAAAAAARLHRQRRRMERADPGPGAPARADPGRPDRPRALGGAGRPGALHGRGLRERSAE